MADKNDDGWTGDLKIAGTTLTVKDGKIIEVKSDTDELTKAARHGAGWDQDEKKGE